MRPISFLRVLSTAAAAGLLSLISAIQPAQATEAGTAADEFEVVFEEWWVAARNNELDYAFIDDGGGLSGGGELQTLSHDRQATPRISVRWRPTSDRDLALVTTFWDYDDSVATATGEHPLAVGALLASPDFAIGRSLVDSATASSRLRASGIDIGAAWEHSFGDRSTAVIEGAIRWFRYERESNVAYRRELATVDEEFVTQSTDSRGIGPRVGARFHRDLGHRFGLGVRIGLAVPLGDRETSADDTALIGGVFDRASVSRSSTQRAFVQLDGALSFSARLGKGWSAGLAYAFEFWTGVEDRRRFVDEVSQNTAVLEEGDVAFSGWTVGVTYAFGD